MRQKLRQGARRPTTGQHGRGTTPGERRGDLLALNLAPVPADRSGQPSTACKFVLVGLANYAEPDSMRQHCYAVGLHPCQFIWPSLYRGHRV